MAAVGVAETSYLIRQRISSRKAACFLGENCDKVLESKYNKTFFIPNDVLGILFYFFVLAATFLAVVGYGSVKFIDLFVFVSVGFGCAASFYFTYLQWRVIKSWCFWCLMSAFTIWMMGFILLTSVVF